MKKLLSTILPKHYQRSLLSQSNLSIALRQYLSTPLLSVNTLIKDVEFLVLDFETTGLNSRKDKVVSMGYALVKDMHLIPSFSQHFLINPNRPLSESNVSIHQITDDEIDQGMAISKALDILLTEMNNRALVVHFDSVEKSFINSICERLYQINPLPMLMIDTLKIESRKMIHTQGFIQSNSLRLFNLRSKYNLPRYKAHNAMQDAIGTAELFLSQIEYMGSPNTIKLRDLI
jgi:DNA polymerase III subunit epsilon